MTKNVEFGEDLSLILTSLGLGPGPADKSEGWWPCLVYKSEGLGPGLGLGSAIVQWIWCKGHLACINKIDIAVSQFAQGLLELFYFFLVCDYSQLLEICGLYRQLSCFLPPLRLTTKILLAGAVLTSRQSRFKASLATFALLLAMREHAQQILHRLQMQRRHAR